MFSRSVRFCLIFLFGLVCGLAYRYPVDSTSDTKQTGVVRTDAKSSSASRPRNLESPKEVVKAEIQEQPASVSTPEVQIKQVASVDYREKKIAAEARYYGSLAGIIEGKVPSDIPPKFIAAMSRLRRDRTDRELTAMLDRVRAAHHRVAALVERATFVESISEDGDVIGVYDSKRAGITPEEFRSAWDDVYESIRGLLDDNEQESVREVFIS